MTRVVGLLSWYDENPQWLREAITSYARCGLQHLVAVDGAYLLLEGGKARSPRRQAKTIVDTCDTLGLGLTLHQPDTVWVNNEIEKRSAMFALGETVTTENDWYVVIDADEVVEHPIDLRKDLGSLDAAEVTMVDRYHQDDPVVKANPGMPLETEYPIRKVFRALRGLRVEGNHFTYRTDEKVLWNNGNVGAVDVQDLRVMRVLHRTRERNLARHRQQYDYYARRDQVGAEKSQGDKCAYCEAPADLTMDGDLEVAPEGYAVSDRIPVCEKHVQRVRFNNAMDWKFGKPGLTAEHVLNANNGVNVKRFVKR